MKTRSRASRIAVTLLAAFLATPVASVPAATASDYPAASDDLALEFSPTGVRMVTTHILRDGPCPFIVQVRMAACSTPTGSEWFGAIHWESDRKLLLQAAGRKAAAMTRCTLRSCERISPLRRVGDRDPREAMPTWHFADESLRDR